MGAQCAERFALMSIHPEYANLILDGSKRVEFRKRKIAPDISVVLIYATMPVAKVVGYFRIGGYDIGSPTQVWERNKGYAGISRDGFRNYYSGTRRAVGILIKEATRFASPFPLTDYTLPLRAPQSFSYLPADPDLLLGVSPVSQAGPEEYESESTIGDYYPLVPGYALRS